jgi:hypothetical protein
MPEVYTFQHVLHTRAAGYETRCDACPGARRPRRSCHLERLQPARLSRATDGRGDGGSSRALPPPHAATGNPSDWSDWSDKSDHTRRFEITARQDQAVPDAQSASAWPSGSSAATHHGPRSTVHRYGGTRSARLLRGGPGGSLDRPRTNVRGPESHEVAWGEPTVSPGGGPGGSEPPLAFRDVALSDTAGGASAPAGGLARLEHSPGAPCERHRINNKPQTPFEHLYSRWFRV